MSQPIIRQLPVTLTESEHIDRARAQGRILRECQEAKRAKKDAAAKAKLAIDSMELEATLLGRVLETGEEYRPVECYERVNRLGRFVEIVRRDTDETVETRALTPAEEQLTFERMIDEE